jgi:hypothetical protein
VRERNPPINQVILLSYVLREKTKKLSSRKIIQRKKENPFNYTTSKTVSFPNLKREEKYLQNEQNSYRVVARAFSL